MYTIKVGDKSYDILVKGNAVEVDGKSLEYNIVHLENNRHHLLLGNKSYNLEVVSYDTQEKKAHIKVGLLQVIGH